jgi:hypothetical protein
MEQKLAEPKQKVKKKKSKRVRENFEINERVVN